MADGTIGYPWLSRVPDGVLDSDAEKLASHLECVAYTLAGQEQPVDTGFVTTAAGDVALFADGDHRRLGLDGLGRKSGQ